MAKKVHRAGFIICSDTESQLKQKGKGTKGGQSRDDAAWARTDVIEREHMHNERFEKYYKAQNVLPEEEWSQFLETMRNPLPTTFRVAGSRQ